MTALEYLHGLPVLPPSRERGKLGRPSKGEIRRWLLNQAVVINGQRPRPFDEVGEVHELVFFPNSTNRVSMV